MKQLLDIKLQDRELEAVRRAMHEAITELQRSPLAGARILRDVVLAEGVTTPVPHGLGRPAAVYVTPPRGPTATGRIEELRDGTYDRSRYVVLKATGFVASITVDLVVL